MNTETIMQTHILNDEQFATLVVKLYLLYIQRTYNSSTIAVLKLAQWNVPVVSVTDKQVHRLQNPFFITPNRVDVQVDLDWHWHILLAKVEYISYIHLCFLWLFTV